MGAVPAPGPVEWRDWLARQWRIENEPVVFPVANAQGEQAQVDSCVALFQADDRHMQVDNVNFGIFRSRASDCHAARIIADASPAERTYLAGFVMDAEQVRDLPVWLAFTINNDDERKVRKLQEGGGTLGDFIGDAAIVAGRNEATIHEGWGGRQSLSIAARGDFNGDGIEDLLVSSYAWIEGGSYTAVALSIVTRVAAGAPLTVVERIPVMGPGSL